MTFAPPELKLKLEEWNKVHPSSMAEIRYGAEVDVWSAGVTLLYCLLKWEDFQIFVGDPNQLDSLLSREECKPSILETIRGMLRLDPKQRTSFRSIDEVYPSRTRVVLPPKCEIDPKMSRFMGEIYSSLEKLYDIEVTDASKELSKELYMDILKRDTRTTGWLDSKDHDHVVAICAISIESMLNQIHCYYPHRLDYLVSSRQSGRLLQDCVLESFSSLHRSSGEEKEQNKKRRNLENHETKGRENEGKRRLKNYEREGGIKVREGRKITRQSVGMKRRN